MSAGCACMMVDQSENIKLWCLVGKAHSACQRRLRIVMVGDWSLEDYGDSVMTTTEQVVVIDGSSIQL